MRQQSNYKILGLLGRGQFGRVFAAVDRKSGTLVALKELKLKQLATSSFLRELNFLVTLDCVNIVGCKALEHYQNHRYIVMDYCESGTLRNLIDNSSLDINRSLQLVIDILSGLEFAHGKGIIHRDLKPENILLKVSDRFYTAHISDFGIAQLHSTVPSAAGNTGSPAYMAPEQFYGQYSYGCDLYAVGIMLFELVVGERPFSGMPQELLSAHLNQPVTIPKSVPFVLRSAIAKALQKLPRRRFQNAKQMRESLQLIQSILEVDTSVSVPSFETLTPVATEILEQPVTHMAIAPEQTYLASKNQLALYSDSGSNLTATLDGHKFALDGNITSLQPGLSGCFINTSSSLYYLPYNSASQLGTFGGTLLPIAIFPTTSLVTAIDPQEHWFAASYLPKKSKTAAWSIFKLPTCQLQRSQINRKPWNFLIALNCRYGLGIYQNKQQNTEFHLFNRRSNWLAKFTAALRIKAVTYNPLFPNLLLATEANNQAILITLKPFRIERIFLKITPTLITSYPLGYLLCDRRGKFVAIDGKDLKLSYFQIPLSAEFRVTAIATSKTQLLVASASDTLAYLQKFSLIF